MNGKEVSHEPITEVRECCELIQNASESGLAGICRNYQSTKDLNHFSKVGPTFFTENRTTNECHKNSIHTDLTRKHGKAQHGGHS